MEVSPAEPLLFADQSFFDGKGRKSRNGMEIQLLLEVGPMFLHSLGTDAEILGNFIVPVTLGGQFKDFSFSMGQSLPGSLGFYGFLPVQVTLDHVFSNTGADIELAI